ncbi:MAG: CamS family sex pheromone protein [Erysipelotrichaceae bacterium]|nr:CamS family sex pheromone protein [Erysipelotrichaceae bacterium]
MRKKIMLWIMILTMISITGCKNNEDEIDKEIILTETNKGEYAYVIPYEATDTRNYHGTYQSRHDIIEIGSGLERYSKAYFNPDDYYALEGKIITRDILLTLVARESETNAQGLNPSKGSSFKTGNGNDEVVDAVIVTDVFELDFIEKDNQDLTVDGITLAMIVNKRQTVNINGITKEYTLSDDRLWEFASNAGRKLESYLRTFEQVADKPIYILIYSTASSDETLAGQYIGGGYFEGRSGQFDRFDEKWVLIPTSEASAIDSDTYNKFLNMKRAITAFLPESVNIIAEAKYVNNEAEIMKIKIRLQGKTYAEVRALTQYTVQLIRDFNDQIHIIVTIDSNDEIIAIIERQSNSEDISTTYIN